MDAACSTDRRVARIPCGIDAPADARRWASWLTDAVAPATGEAILIAVSELVTNAVRHAGLPAGALIEVRGELRRDRVTLMVRDRGVGLPARLRRHPRRRARAAPAGSTWWGARHAGADGPAGRRRHLRVRALTPGGRAAPVRRA